MITVQTNDFSLSGKEFDFTIKSTVDDFDSTSDSSLEFSVSFKGDIPESVSSYFVTEIDIEDNLVT